MKENFTIDVSFGYPCEMTIETKSAASDAEMDTDIWGKKFKFQGLGKNLIHDRVFLREKLIEFTENFGTILEMVN